MTGPGIGVGPLIAEVLYVEAAFDPPQLMMTCIASLRLNSCEPHRVAIKHQFDRVPMDSPRGAEQRAVVDPHHEPTGCASAQLSGDLCGSRALRAPQGNSESPGVAFFWLLFLAKQEK